MTELDKEKALENFQIALNISPEDFNLIKNVLILYIDLEKYFSFCNSCISSLYDTMIMIVEIIQIIFSIA